MRRRIAVPLAADRRVPGIVRREHPSQPELGGLRPRAAAGDDPAEPVRPAVRRAGPELGRAQEEHARRGARGPGGSAAVARPAGSASPRRAPHVGPRAGARDREPAVRLRQERQGAGGRRRPDGLSAHREDPVRSAGARAGVGADARRVVHADQVPEPDAVPVARLHASAAPRLHAHQRGLARRPAHHARHLPLARRGVRLSAGRS